MRLHGKPSVQDSRAIDAAVERYGRFVGKTATWRRMR
jgi:hypothetical protein